MGFIIQQQRKIIIHGHSPRSELSRDNTSDSPPWSFDSLHLRSIDRATMPSQLSPIVDTLFKAGQGAKPTTTQGAINAPLDKDTLQTLLKPVIKSDQSIAVARVDINAGGTDIQYIVGPSQRLANPKGQPTLEEMYHIRIHVCSGASKASELLKNYLNRFDSLNEKDPSVYPIKNLTAPLGDCALRTQSSAFWIRGESVFAEINHTTASKTPSPPPKPGPSTGQSLPTFSVTARSPATARIADFNDGSRHNFRWLNFRPGRRNHRPHSATPRQALLVAVGLDRQRAEEGAVDSGEPRADQAQGRVGLHCAGKRRC